jgi:transcriptional regulator with XRE-family HTH domain
MIPPDAKSRGVFGLRLKWARRNTGLPQDKLGVKIGLDEFVASARISRYESSKHAPPYDVAKKLALALHVPMAFLYCEDDRMAQLILLVAQFTDEEWTHLFASIKTHSSTDTTRSNQD